MRTVLLVALGVALVLSGLASTAAAQTGSQATLVITIAGGVHTGHSLYEIPKQPVLIAPGTHDTLRLVRSIGSGLMLGFSGTYFPSGLVGLHGEISFIDLPLANSCDSLYQASGDPRNMEVCGNIDNSTVSSSVFGFMGGVTLRTAPRGQVSPYLRGSLGITVTSGSTVAMEGAFVQGGQVFVQPIILDDDPQGIALATSLAAGITAPVGTGYQLRLELRDDYFPLERATGAADALGNAPKESRYYHHFSLLIGFDVVLEQKRGRRY